MSRVIENGPLGATGVEYLSRAYRQACTKPLDFNHVEFVVDPLNSSLTINSLSYTSLGEVGIYRAAHTVSYQKADLGKVVPAPIAYHGYWPTTFGEFATYMRNAHGIVLEDNMYSLTPDGPALRPSSPLTGYPDQNDVVRLYALPAAVLWTPGSSLAIRVLTAYGRQSIAGRISQAEPGSMESLIRI